MAGAASSDFGDDDGGGLMSDINVTPLVDVVLVLLIVFMITMPTIIGSTPIKVNLPETNLTEVPNIEKIPIDLYLKRAANGELALYMGQNPEPVNEESLRLTVKAQGPAEEQPVSLSADKDIAYGEVVRVMDMLAGMGLHKLSLNTKHVNK